MYTHLPHEREHEKPHQLVGIKHRSKFLAKVEQRIQLLDLPVKPPVHHFELGYRAALVDGSSGNIAKRPQIGRLT